MPIVEELRVTDFEDSPYCRNLAYARGAFGDLGQEGCQRDGTRQFDAAALADHARLAEAMTASTVATNRIRTTFDADGVLETAWFALVVLHERRLVLRLRPDRRPAQEESSGREEFTRIGDDWWCVRSFDD